jgi:hypothetical protein
MQQTYLFVCRQVRQWFVVLAFVMLIATGSASRGQCGQWLSIGGVDDNPGWVWAVAVMPDGDLIAGGGFASMAGVACSNVARWDGTAWSPLGRGVNGFVYAVHTLPDGDVLVGGLFSEAGGVPANGVARWNGETWHPLGAGVAGGNAAVTSFARMPDGSIVAAGEFTSAGGTPCNNIARWDGTSWSCLSFPSSGAVLALAAMPDGSLLAAGEMSPPVWRWNASGWTLVGPANVGGPAYALEVLPQGDVIVTGVCSPAAHTSCGYIRRWDGTQWSAIGSGSLDGAGRTLHSLPSGDLLVGGWFTSIDGVPTRHVARWNGVEWTPWGFGVDSVVTGMAVLPSGDWVASGWFSDAGGTTVRGIAAFRPGLGLAEHPSASTSCAGSSVTLSVRATGQSLRYQWRKDGVDVPGATASVLTLASAVASDSGLYVCTVSDACGTVVTSRAASVTLIPPPVIEVQPVDQPANPDMPVLFTVHMRQETRCATAGPLRYQWQRRNPMIVDPALPAAWIDIQDGPQFVHAQSSALVVVRPIPALATGYRCRITGGCDCGTTYTDVVNFSIGCPADFNADGGVDFSDIEAFFVRWENGC